MYTYKEDYKRTDELDLSIKFQ